MKIKGDDLYYSKLSNVIKDLIFIAKCWFYGSIIYVNEAQPGDCHSVSYIFICILSIFNYF